MSRRCGRFAKLSTSFALCLVVLGCSPKVVSTPPPPTPTVQSVDAYLRIYGGLAGVYRTILDETSCPKLQDSFFTATDNHSLGYQAAIADRGKDLGCPTFLFNRP